GVARARGCLEGDALVVAGRKQEASLFHHLAQEERRSRVEVDDVGPPPSRPLEVERERGQSVERRARGEADGNIHVAVGTERATRGRAEDVPEPHARVAGEDGANSYRVDAGWYATARARTGRRRGRLMESAIRWGRALLDARPDLQRHRIDAEAADGALPHLGRRRLEDERRIRRRGEPRRRRQLGVELARAPPGVTEEEARAPPHHVGGRGLEEPAEYLDRRGQAEALGDPLAVRHARVVAEEEEAALRLDRAARPQHEAAVAARRRIEHHR